MNDWNLLLLENPVVSAVLEDTRWYTPHNYKNKI